MTQPIVAKKSFSLRWIIASALVLIVLALLLKKARAPKTAPTSPPTKQIDES